MSCVVVTGASGFIGRHLVSALRREGAEVRPITRESTTADLDAALALSDEVYHLAGVNRPTDPAEFEAVNAQWTRSLADRIRSAGRSPLVVFASSTQAESSNPYGSSKRRAEEELCRLEAAGVPVRIYRLPGVFGRGARPNYNSAVATFCHMAARGESLPLNDPNSPVLLVHVDDVVAEFLRARADRAPASKRGEVTPVFRTTVGKLAAHVSAFAASRRTLQVPDFSDPFVFRLYATYLSYLPEGTFAYDLEKRVDARGTLAEFTKSAAGGQIFVSRTHPGITRGNHWHSLKTEKFFVLEGDAMIRFRSVDGSHVMDYRVTGTDFRVVDIPPGYTHSIENVGRGELIVLFWSSEVFDPARPDTNMLPVLDA